MLQDDNHTPSSMHNGSDLEASSQQEAATLTEEDRLAEAHQLGKVLKRYKSEPTAFTAEGLPSVPRVSGFSIMARGSRAMRLLIPMLFITTLAIWWGTHTPPWLLIMICLLVLAPWLANVFSRLPKDVAVGLQNAEFYLCTNGLMIIQWARVRAIRWNQIQTVERNMTRDLLNYSYTLYLNESAGKPVTLDRSLVGPDLKELGNTIEREVGQRLLPRAIGAYEEGYVLNFGSINVTAQGLTLENKEDEESGQQSLPWERFVSVEDYNGYLITIKERKDLKEVKIIAAWQKLEAASMLNICVFVPLVHHIHDMVRTNLREHANEDATSDQPLLPSSEWSVYEDGTF